MKFETPAALRPYLDWRNRPLGNAIVYIALALIIAWLVNLRDPVYLLELTAALAVFFWLGVELRKRVDDHTEK